MIKKLAISLALCAVLLLAVNAAHFSLLPVNVVFYGALLDAAIAVAIAGWLSWRFVFARAVDRVVFGQYLLICLLGGYIYAITVPTIIDRSYSIYLLEKIQQSGGGIKQAAFDQTITTTFMREHRLNEARFTEQLESGTIVIENGCVKLTPRGERIANFTRWYRQHLLPQHRLLMGKYTDELTDPFRHSSANSDYRCLAE